MKKSDFRKMVETWCGSVSAVVLPSLAEVLRDTIFIPSTLLFALIFNNQGMGALIDNCNKLHLFCCPFYRTYRKILKISLSKYNPPPKLLMQKTLR